MLFTDNALQWLETILWERFGHRFKLIQREDDLTLFLSGSASKITFDQLETVFHQYRSDFPCEQWRASSDGFKASVDDIIPAPSEHKLRNPLVELNDQGAIIHYDILGLTYWMLARLEEIGRFDLDSHQRFPATASHAYLHEYLERPIVDEWLIILGQVMHKVWPRLALKEHQYKVRISHDVDSPSRYAFKSWSTIARLMAGHLLKRHDLIAFLKAPYVKLATRSALHPNDEFNTFDWLMDVAEANHLQVAFYFICGRSNPAMDGDYELEHPVIRKLMRKVHERGHEVGLHPSYNTFRKPELLVQEAKRLLRVCEEEGIVQTEWGGRMHYLRWEQPITLNGWVDAGFDYDSTMGYADHVGFRCGTCYSFPAFDALAQRVIPLRLQPLIVMEQTLLSVRYMGGANGKIALDKVCRLINSCQSVKGCFSLLWHNSQFLNSDSRDNYQYIVEQAAIRI